MRKKQISRTFLWNMQLVFSKKKFNSVFFTKFLHFSRNFRWFYFVKRIKAKFREKKRNIQLASEQMRKNAKKCEIFAKRFFLFAGNPTFKGTAINQKLSSLHQELIKIKLTVLFISSQNSLVTFLLLRTCQDIIRIIVRRQFHENIHIYQNLHQF